MVKCALIIVAFSLSVCLSKVPAEPQGGSPVKARLSLEMQTGGQGG